MVPPPPGEQFDADLELCCTPSSCDAPGRVPGYTACVAVWPDSTGDAYIGGGEKGIAEEQGGKRMDGLPKCASSETTVASDHPERIAYRTAIVGHLQPL
jgi:hypothetical protein